MKHEENIDISFGGTVTATPEVAKESKKEAVKTVVAVTGAPKNAAIQVPAVEPATHEVLDPYASAVEAFFQGYQEFQEGMQVVRKVQHPRFIFGKLVTVLEAFQAVIARFQTAEYDVPAEFQPGQEHLLAGIAKYEVFLVEYPAVLMNEKGKKAMKKVYALGKMSAEADQDMKKAFRSFDEATQGA